jgi:predicted dehydrogenase
MPDQVPADRPTEFGVVGLGYWGPNLLRVLGDDPGVSVRWICDLDPARLARFQRRHPTAQVTADVREVLADPGVDAVVIATPIYTHFDLAAASLRAGKHTFVEKPLAPSAVLADELRSLSRIHERIVMCGHTFLYSPPVRMLKRMIDDRMLGDVFFVSSSRVNLGLHQRDVSVIWDLGPHDFSILRYWLGETPRTIRAIGRDSIVPGIADVAFITMTFPSGVVSNVELSWLAPSKLRRTVVVGSEKMVVYDDGDAEPIRLFDHGVIYRDPETFGQYHLSYRTGDILSPKVDTYEPLSAELADLARAIRSGDSMAWQADLARDVVLMTEAADRSLRNGGTEVDVQALGRRAPRTTSRALQRAKEPAA